jgi:NaMN:DMB phosphoribosyltransferase
MNEQVVSKRLDEAERSGREAERLLKQAKETGDKEAAKYVKFAAATTTTATTASAVTKK